MKLMLWIGDEGPTDIDLKDGDIFAVYPDNWQPGIEEAKRFLVIQTDDYLGDLEELLRPEHAIGPSVEEPVVRHMRKYFVPYWLKLTPTELAQVRDKEQSVSPITGRFSLIDISRK